jgi:hypothetical protein
MIPPRGIGEIAGKLKNNPEMSVVIKPGDTSFNQWTEKRLLEQLQELLVDKRLLIWSFPKSGAIVVELDFYKEPNDGSIVPKWRSRYVSRLQGPRSYRDCAGVAIPPQQMQALW